MASHMRVLILTYECFAYKITLLQVVRSNRFSMLIVIRSAQTHEFKVRESMNN